MLVSSCFSKENLFHLIFAVIEVFCKIKRSLMKDLTCVSPSDNTILIVSATDSGNVYAKSLMVQRESRRWSGLQGIS